MNPNEIKKFLKIAKDLEANVTIDKETVVVILDYINQLETENMELKSDVITLKHSNEYLKNKYDEIMSLSKRIMQKLIKAHKRLKTTKSEAIKEFAEKIKSKIYTAHFGSIKKGFTVTTINPSDIDNLVKEMVGEQE